MSDLVIPLMVLALFGWLVPRGLFLLFPEGVRPLIWLAVSSFALMFVVSVVFWMGLYQARGAPLGEFFADGLWPGLWFFGRLAGASVLIWGPILVLSVAGLPKMWVNEEW